MYNANGIDGLSLINKTYSIELKNEVHPKS